MKSTHIQLFLLITIKRKGPKSSSKSVTTHKEVKKIKKIKAEAGESIVDLEWTKHDLAVIIESIKMEL